MLKLVPISVADSDIRCCGDTICVSSMTIRRIQVATPTSYNLGEIPTVVDFSKLRLPAGDVKPGEGTEPATNDSSGSGVSVDGDASRSVSPTSNAVAVEANVASEGGAKAEAGEEAVETGNGANDRKAVGDTTGAPLGASGLRLRLPGAQSSPMREAAPSSVESVSPSVESIPSRPLQVSSPNVALVPAPVEEVVSHSQEVPVAVSRVESLDGITVASPVIESSGDAEVVVEAGVTRAPEQSGVGVAPMLESGAGAVNPLLEDDDEFFEQFPEDDDTFLDESVEVGNEESLYPSRDAVNPLLEDDEDEEVLSAAELAQQLGLKSGLTEFSDEDEPAEDGEAFTGFDESFRSLLDDDDEEDLVIPSRRPNLLKPSVVAPVEPPVQPVLESVSPLVEVKPAPEFVSVKVPARSAKSPEQLEESAAQRKADLRAKEAESKKAKEFDSDFIGDTTNVVKVNAAGETRNEAGKERKRLEKPALGGKLKPKEIEFFKSLGTVRSEFSDGMVTTDLITGPLGKKESEAEKKARLERLERVFDSRNVFRAGKTFKLDSKTVDTLSFLALFRYATHSHIARMFGEKPLTTTRRLRKMRDAGLVASKKLYSQHAIWFLTESGVIVSGYDMKHITEAKLTPSMFPHQFTVNHVAANLMGGQLNVLNLAEFPVPNRTNIKGETIMGEQLTSELEILSSFAKIKLFEQSSTFRPKLMEMRDNEFGRWREAPNREQVPTPEMVFGNEWMFTLFPPLAVGVAYHVPDLVVKRQRAADGTPRSIAVEIEINNKPTASYEKTLRAYADDNLIFGQVIWVCKTVGPAKKLEKVGRDLGIIQSGKLKIVPIWTNAGVFKGRDLWTI